MAREPLAVTGLGLVSAAGGGAAAFRDALEAGRSHLAPLPASVARDLPVTIGGRVPDAVLGGDPGTERAFRAARAAAAEALDHARLDAGPEVGLALGTALGGTEAFEAWAAGDDAAADPLERLTPHGLARRLGREIGLSGEPATFSVTCASALYAVEQAWADLLLGRRDAVLVGGLDTLSRTIQGGFCALEALSSTAAPDRPAPQDGIVLGEAAAFVVLERPERARARGARVHGLLRGLGLRSDGTHVTSPDASGAGMRTAAAAALADAGRAPDGVGCVSLTAGGSPVYAETYEGALGELLGPAWSDRATTWEAEVGHALAASGTLGVLHACQVLAAGVPGRSGPAPASVLALTVGFGGQNGAALVEREEAP